VYYDDSKISSSLGKTARLLFYVVAAVDFNPANNRKSDSSTQASSKA